jgi:hypothetical protein
MCRAIENGGQYPTPWTATTATGRGCSPFAIRIPLGEGRRNNTSRPCLCVYIFSELLRNANELAKSFS